MCLPAPPKPKGDVPRSQLPNIPEPRHRVPPQGVASGISFRKLPTPSLNAIRKICEHYEGKCSGQYSSLASRYISQMCQEIKTQVDSIEKQENGNNKQLKKSTENGTEKGRDNEIIDNDNQGMLQRKVEELQNQLAKANVDLQQYKINTENYVKQHSRDFEEKLKVDRLHFKNSNESLKRDFEEKLKKARNETSQVKSDARLIIDFIRKKANESLAEAEVHRSAEKKNLINRMNFLEKQLKVKFNGCLSKIEKQMKTVLLEGKQNVQGDPVTNLRAIPDAVGSKSPLQRKYKDPILAVNDTIVTDKSEYGVFSDDSISTKDEEFNGMGRYPFVQTSKKLRSEKITESEWLKSRIKELEEWTDTLTTALRSGAHLKGINGEFFTYQDNDSNLQASIDIQKTMNSKWPDPGGKFSSNEWSANRVSKKSSRKSNIIPPSPPKRR